MGEYWELAESDTDDDDLEVSGAGKRRRADVDVDDYVERMVYPLLVMEGCRLMFSLLS